MRKWRHALDCLAQPGEVVRPRDALQDVPQLLGVDEQPITDVEG